MIGLWSIRLLCSLLCALPWAGLAATQPDFTAEERQWIRLHPVVHYAADPDLAPLEYVREGQYHGLSAEYLRAVSERSGLRFERVATAGWADTQQALLDGRIDLLPNVMPRRVSPQVHAQLLYSAPYFVTSSIIVTRGNAPVVMQMGDLHGKIVAVRRHGSYTRHIIEGHPQIRLLDVDSPREALDAVVAGRADATIGTDALLLPLMRHRHPGLLGISGTAPGLVFRSHFGVHKNSPLLHSIVCKSLASLSAEETDRMDAVRTGTAHVDGPSLLSIVHHHASTLAALTATMLLLAALAWHARRAQQRAQRSEAAKSRFLAIMSHEIRTPMNAVLASIEMLQHSSLDERQQRFTRTAAHAAEALLGLLNDVLDLSKLSARRLQLECIATDVGVLALGAVELARMAAGNDPLPIHLHIDDAQQLDALIDPTRMRQVLGNLLGNAVKFTLQGSIELRVRILAPPADCPQRQGSIVVTVTDTGIGIPRDKIAHVFEAYAQAESSTTRRYGGSGLGLTICRELVTLMGGTLALRSTPGVGTVVSVSLPARLRPRAPTPPVDGPANTIDTAASLPAPSVAANARPRVLVVEDHPGNQFVLSEQLQMLQIDCLVVDDGQAALAALAQFPFALVLMDCHLPQMSGYETSRRIRALAAGGPHLPIIAISAAADRAHLAHCLDSGMDGVLKKPLRLDALREVLQTWLGDVLPVEVPASAPPCSSRQTLHDLMQATLQQDMAALQQALQEQDAVVAESLTHRIKGAAEVARMPWLADAAAHLERRLREPGLWHSERIRVSAEALQAAIQQAFGGTAPW